MWDLPRPGLEPVSPALAGRFLTTAPPGKPKINHFKANYSVAFSPFTVLCNHHLSCSEYFHSEYFQGVIHFPPPPSPWQTPICFLSLWICWFWSFHINGIIQYVAFCGWFLSLSTMFLSFIHDIVHIRTSFYGWIIFHCMDILQFVHPFITWWTFGLFPPFGYYE